MKVLEYLLPPQLENNLEIDQRQFAYRKATSCLDAITPLEETVAHYNKEHTDVHCAMVDLSKAYGRIIISSLCDKFKASYLPWHIVYLIEFVKKKTHMFALHMKDVLAMNGK